VGWGWRSDLKLKLGPREHVPGLEHADHGGIHLERPLLHDGHLVLLGLLGFLLGASGGEGNAPLLLEVDLDGEHVVVVDLLCAGLHLRIGFALAALRRLFRLPMA
jgi:hypothetical protein